jgi:hypothetical protein
VAQDIPSSKAPTWKPDRPLDQVPAAPKGVHDPAAPLMRRARMMLFIQGALLLMLVAAAFLVREDRFTSALYAWSGVIPLGFSAVFWTAARRGERVRRDKRWTIQWERAEAKRTYRWLGVVMLAWTLGLVAAYLVLA